MKVYISICQLIVEDHHVHTVFIAAHMLCHQHRRVADQLGTADLAGVFRNYSLVLSLILSKVREFHLPRILMRLRAACT